MNLERVVQCLLCGREGKLAYRDLTDVRFFIEGRFDLRYCPQCSLFWLDPRPSSGDMSGFYKDFLKEEPVTAQDELRYQKRTLARLRNWMREVILCGYFGYRNIHARHNLCALGKFLGAFLSLRARATYDYGAFFPRRNNNPEALIVDVGAGNCLYVSLMKSYGWKVMGIDPHPDSESKCRCAGIPFFKGTLEEAQLPSNSVDHLTMLHVIEHVYDPVLTINECYRVLKPGGRLLLRTPNVGSLGHFVFKDNFYSLDPPRHLFLFTAKSISSLVKKASFRAIHIRFLKARSRKIYLRSISILKKRNTANPTSLDRLLSVFFMSVESFLSLLGVQCAEELEIEAVK